MICPNAVREMVDQSGTLIGGPFNSGEAQAVIESAAESGSPAISSTVSADEQTGPDDNVLRGVASSSARGIYLGGWIFKKGFTAVAFFYRILATWLRLVCSRKRPVQTIGGL